MAIRPLSDQQPLRIALLSGLGLHPHPAAGGAGLASPIVAAAATPMGLGCIAFASFALPDQLQSAAPLVPALRSSWLVMHVSVIMVSYAALLVGSLLSLAVLVTDRDQALELRSEFDRQWWLSPGGFCVQWWFRSAAIGSASTNEQLDSLSYRTITVGFLMLTVGIVSGTVWANEAWEVIGAGIPRRPGP